MVGGFNTNIRYQGRIFHVQTEDGGAESPQIVTLLYSGGAILFSKKRSYEQHVDAADRESKVRQLMEEQHRVMVAALKAGKLDEKVGLACPTTMASGSGDTAPVEFGAGLISERSLDEVVLDVLAG